MQRTRTDRTFRTLRRLPLVGPSFLSYGVAGEALHVVPQKISSRMMMMTSSVTMPPPMYITAPFVVVAIRDLLLLPYPLS
jgi:hypothetical protein